MQTRFSNSNQTLRFDRTSREALGYELKSWHFPPKNPDAGDRAVAIACIVITVLLGAIPFIFDVKLGG